MTVAPTTRRATPVDQLVLPGQAAAPAGPIDVSGMYLMHRAFRRDLANFEAAAAATPIDDHECWIRLHDRWALFAGSLHKHHSGEDAGLWPVLLERADDDVSKGVLAAMSAEHEHIVPLLEACETAFATLARTDDANRPGAQRELTRLTADLRRLLIAH